MKKHLRIPMIITASLMLVILILIFPYLEQRNAARWIQNNGGWVRTAPSSWLVSFFAVISPNDESFLSPPPDDFDWWNIFQEVTWVDMYDVEMSDDDLLILNHFPQLEVARLNNINITGECFSDLDSLINVHAVTLQNTSITNESLKYLASVFPSATSLMLSGAAITDDSVPYLEAFTNLWSVAVDGTQMTTGGVHQLRRSLLVIGLDGKPQSLLQ